MLLCAVAGDFHLELQTWRDALPQAVLQHVTAERASGV